MWRAEVKSRPAPISASDTPSRFVAAHSSPVAAAMTPTLTSIAKGLRAEMPARPAGEKPAMASSEPATSATEPRTSRTQDPRLERSPLDIGVS